MVKITEDEAEQKTPLLKAMSAPSPTFNSFLSLDGDAKKDEKVEEVKSEEPEEKPPAGDADPELAPNETDGLKKRSNSEKEEEGDVLSDLSKSDPPIKEKFKRFRENFLRMRIPSSSSQDVPDSHQEPAENGSVTPAAVTMGNIFSKASADKFYQKIPKTAQDVNKKLKAQIWNSVVTIVLVEGKNLLPMDPDGCSDPYAKFRSVAGCCKFKLGNEKYKSKIAFRTLCPQWLEQFDLHIYDDQSQILEITVWDYDSRTKDDYIGKCSIDLSTLEKEKTHGIEKELEDGGGTLYLLLTISGTTASETISDLTTYQENPMEKKNIIKRYSLVRSFQNMKDVGYLQVKVFKAQGLAAADINGKSDPFCVLELVNARLQTQTEYKTLTPQWNKIFTFQVKDIHTYLEITVYDEDKDGKVDFLGKVSIPLLKIRNGEKRWYALKDKKMRMRAKGNNPQILLELSVYYNPVRAAVRTMNPKETKYMQPDRKFKRQIFLRNVARLKALTPALVEMGKLVRSFFEWESPIKSIIAYVGFLLITLYFELWMVPIGVLLLFVKNYIVLSVTGWMYYRDDFDEFYDDDDDEEEKEKTRVQEEEKKSLKERFQAIQDVTQMVQNIVGDIASFTESGINTFNFTVPFLSYMAITLLVVATIALYYLPLRLIIIAAGTNKFFKKLFRPHAIPNNEVLDFLSRVPDNEILVECRELRIQPLTEADKKMKDQRKRKPTASFNS